MVSVLISFFQTLRGLAQSRAALHLEVLALRHQLQVLQRSRPRRSRKAVSQRMKKYCTKLLRGSYLSHQAAIAA
jgi:hypothetical protein